MKKLAFLVVLGSAVWMLFGAVPAFADNGPHVTSVGQLTDRCAGCHRLHTAKAAYVLVQEEPALCYTCHGTGGTGSALSVQNGTAYTNSTGDRGAAVGALRGGGFEYALINSHNSGLTRFGAAAGTNVNRLSAIAALDPTAAEAATSSHSVDESPQTVWGAGQFSATASYGTADLKLTCTSCHDPHGGNDGGGATFRVLKNNPAGLAVSSSGVAAAANTLAVACTPASSEPGASGTDNICTTSSGVNSVECRADRSTRTNSTTGVVSQRVRTTCKSSIYPTTVSATASSDAPAAWPAAPAGVAPNIQAVGDVGAKVYTTSNYLSVTQAGLAPADFTGQMANWCSQCHTRYKATSGQTYAFDTGDAVYKYRHQGASTSSASTATSSGVGANCITCHVAHGSNSTTGDYGSQLKAPDGSTVAAADNRLLRVDQRGICSACHVK